MLSFLREAAAAMGADSDAPRPTPRAAAGPQPRDPGAAARGGDHLPGRPRLARQHGRRRRRARRGVPRRGPAPLPHPRGAVHRGARARHPRRAKHRRDRARPGRAAPGHRCEPADARRPGLHALHRTAFRAALALWVAAAAEPPLREQIVPLEARIGRRGASTSWSPCSASTRTRGRPRDGAGHARPGPRPRPGQPAHRRPGAAASGSPRSGRSCSIAPSTASGRRAAVRGCRSARRRPGADVHRRAVPWARRSRRRRRAGDRSQRSWAGYARVSEDKVVVDEAGEPRQAGERVDAERRRGRRHLDRCGRGRTLGLDDRRRLNRRSDRSGSRDRSGSNRSGLHGRSWLDDRSGRRRARRPKRRGSRPARPG